MSAPLTVLAAVLVASLAAGVTSADEIRLTDGRVLDGEIVSAPGEAEVSVKTRHDGMTAVIRVPANQIATIIPGPTVRQKALDAFALRVKAMTADGGSAASYWTLSQEAKTLAQNGQAKKFAQQAIRREPDHAEARAFLGFEKVDGKWLTGADAQAAKGNVLFRGEWMTPARRDALLADETRTAADADAQRKNRLAELEAARQEAEVRRMNEPAPLENTATFGTFTPNQPNVLILKQPGPWCPPAPPAKPALEVHAQGQGNGFNWDVQYRK